MMPSRLFGKPMMVTEFDYAAPNVFRAEGAVLARQTASLVGAVELGDPLAPADPEVSLRICYAQPGEELFAIARRYHVSPGQMLAANDLPDGTARLDEARRLLVPGV